MLRSLRLLLAACLLWCGATTPAAAQSVPLARHPGLEIRYHPLETQLLTDAAEGRLDERDLLRAGLIASGIEDEAMLADWSRRFDGWVAELQAAGVESVGGRQRAAMILQLLHDRVFIGGYESDCSDLAETLRSGRFNCATAVVLFNALAARVGLIAQAIELPGHVMSRISTTDGQLDIETTWPQGVAPDGQRRPSASRRIATANEPSTSAAEMRTRQLTPAALVAVLYYNQGIDCLERGEFAEAVSANCKALWLDPASQPATGNLLAALNNWALDLHERGDSTGALAKLDLGEHIAPDYAPFHENRRAVLRQAVDRFAGAGHYEAALDLLDAHYAQRPADELLATLRFDTYCRWHQAVLQSAMLDAALAHFDRARERYPGASEVVDAELTAWQVRGLALFERGAHGEATEVLALARARFPEDAEIDQGFRAAAMRWAEEAFAEEDYAAAIRRSTYAAQPGCLHGDLVNNVRYAYHRWAGALFAGGQWDEAIRVALAADEDPFLSAAGYGDMAISLVQRQFDELTAAGDEARVAELRDRLSQLGESVERQGAWQHLRAAVRNGQLVEGEGDRPDHRKNAYFHSIGTRPDETREAGQPPTGAVLPYSSPRGQE